MNNVNLMNKDSMFKLNEVYEFLKGELGDGICEVSKLYENNKVNSIVAKFKDNKYVRAIEVWNDKQERSGYIAIESTWGDYWSDGSAIMSFKTLSNDDFKNILKLVKQMKFYRVKEYRE